jgi:hypothetical protein
MTPLHYMYFVLQKKLLNNIILQCKMDTHKEEGRNRNARKKLEPDGLC